VAGENEMKGKWEHKRKSCGASTPCTVYNSAKKKRIFAKFCNSHAQFFFGCKCAKKKSEMEELEKRITKTANQ
jgi:hypothetical protein